MLEDLDIFSDVLGTGAKFAIFLHRNQAAAHVTFQHPPAGLHLHSLVTWKIIPLVFSLVVVIFMLLKKSDELELAQAAPKLGE